MRDDVGKGVYNCYGYCAARKAGEFRWKDEFDPQYFESLGFKILTGLRLFGHIPDDAEIAVFSGQHAARRSNYKLGKHWLWESKLGYSPRILHSLKDLEGGDYGDVNEYWGKI